MLKKIAQLFMGSVFIQGSNIVMYLVLARILEQEQYGSYRQLFLIQNIISTFLISALPTSLLYFAGRQDCKEKVKEYCGFFAIITLALAIFSSLFLILFADNIASILSNPSLSVLVKYFALGIVGFFSISLLPSIFVVLDKGHLQLHLSLLFAVVPVSITVYIAFIGYSLQDIVLGFSLIYCVLGTVVFLIVWKFLVKGRELDILNKIKQTYTYAWPLFLGASLAILGLKVDHLLISYLLGTFTYALYSVGAFEIPIFNLLQNSVSSVILPEITKLYRQHNYEEAKASWKSLNEKVALVTFPLAIALIIEAELVITLLFGNNYSSAADIFRIFTGFVFIRVMTFGVALRATNNVKAELAVSILFLFCSIIVSYIFITLFGVTGGAWSAFISTIAYCITISIVTYKKTDKKVKLWEVYPFEKTLVSIVLLVTAVSTIQYLNQMSSLTSEVMLFTSLFVWFFVYRNDYLVLNKTSPVKPG